MTATQHHLDDADLLRLLDGEPPAAAGAAGHLGECASCSARSELLRRRRARLAALLAATDAPAPPVPSDRYLLGRLLERRGRPPRLRRPPTAARLALRAAAAVVVLVAGSALAAQPAVRQWVARRWTQLTAPRSAAAVADSGARQAPGTPAAPLGPVVSFVPGAGEFVVSFDARPAAGTLTITAGTGPRATAERLGGASEELLVLPAGLRVRNAPTSAASYSLTIPASLRRVRLRLGPPRAADVIVPLAPGESRVVELGAAGR